MRPIDLLVAAGAERDGLRRAHGATRRRASNCAPSVLERFVNVDLSGGERKRAEIVQFGVLRPKFAMLDEIDSGLDVDALRRRGAPPGRGHDASGTAASLAITHFRRLLAGADPDDDPRDESTGGSSPPADRNSPRSSSATATSRFASGRRDRVRRWHRW